MKSDDELWNICMDIYKQMYREALPSADLDKLIEHKETLTNDWYMDYYLPQKRQEEIIDEHLNKHQLTEFEERSIREELHLGFAPTGYKKDIKKELFKKIKDNLIKGE